MSFSKKIVILGMLCMSDSCLAMDQACSFSILFNAAIPLETDLHAYLLLKNFKGIHHELIKGANVKQKDSEGNSLAKAIFEKIASYLFELRMPQLQESMNIKDADHLVECLKLILRNENFDPNESDSKKQFLFCRLFEIIDSDYYARAIKNNSFMEQESDVDLSVDKKANYYIKDLYDCIRLLIQHPKFNPNAIMPNKPNERKTRTLLHFWLKRMNELYGYENGQTSLKPSSDEIFILRDLLRAKVNVNAVDERGYSPLHYVADRGCSTVQNIFATKRNLKIAELLMLHGANPNHVNAKGCVPIDFCFDDTTMVPLFLFFNAQFPTAKHDSTEVTNPYVLEFLNPSGAALKEIKENVSGCCLMGNNKNNNANALNILRSREIRGCSIAPKKYPPTLYTAALMKYTQTKHISYETVCAKIDNSYLSSEGDNYDSVESQDSD